MSAKHSATATLLAVKQPSPATSPPPTDRLKAPTPSDKVAPAQKSMLEKFRLVNTRSALRTPQGSGLGPDGAREEDTTGPEPGDLLDGTSGGSANSSPKVSPKLATPKAGNKSLGGKKGLLQPKDKEDKQQRDKGKAGPDRPGRDEKEQAPDSAPKKASKIASLIPKGSKAAAKKDGWTPASSGIPKLGSKVPNTKQTVSPGSPAGREAEKLRTPKGSPCQPFPKTIPPEKANTAGTTVTTAGQAALDGREASQLPTGPVSGNGTVQLPQQQHCHPNTATVAPFIYR